MGLKWNINKGIKVKPRNYSFNNQNMDYTNFYEPKNPSKSFQNENKFFTAYQSAFFDAEKIKLEKYERVVHLQ